MSFDNTLPHGGPTICRSYTPGPLKIEAAIGDAPERIMVSTVDLNAAWGRWKASPPVTVVEPEKDYECAALPMAASVEGLATVRVRQLRDPAVFQEAGKDYLFYSICGEQGIAGGRLAIP